jgi:predicted AAA+ superfamily ATPase
MSLIVRTLLNQLEADIFQGKALVIMGPRQSGKTTLVNMLLAKHKQKKTLYLNADDIFIRNQLTNPSISQLKNIVADYRIVVIDEAQRIENIGITCKIIVDEIKSAQLIATGSSSFDLANKINEPLTGRKFEYTLYPLAYSEMMEHHSFIEEQRMISQRMLYGYYPEIVTRQGSEEKLLRGLADSYLFKDIYALEQISKPALLENLVKALAFQVSHEVSYNELSQLVGADKSTVEKYVDLLEKAFIIYKLPALHRNVRNEIKKGKKFYFWDNGILNAILGNFNQIESRSDAGALWENFIITERMKLINNRQQYRKFYFWRTTMQQEIDLIEEYSGHYAAYEIKLKQRNKVIIPKTFSAAYPVNTQAVISRENFHEFLIETI